MAPLLEVRNLCVSYTARSGRKFTALAGLTFALERGETLGVLGESGSGKSTLGAALLRMLTANGRIEDGAVRFEGHDLLQTGSREMERIRGDRIALIFQEPSQALHPAIRVERQIGDVIAAHKALERGAMRTKTRQILASVFPNEVERIAKSYPHQLSGGQRARALIAQAIACGPALIVADEPTASLDPITQEETLSLFRNLRQQFKLSLLWITHNPALLAGFADRVMVLYAGRVVEIGPSERVLHSPQHPYTQALLRCLPPGLDASPETRKAKLEAISGEALAADFQKERCRCSFEPRCDDRMEVCTKNEPEMIQLDGAHEVSCFKHVC
jgi:oligopeptide/dipeptide ABC transporter ATP-binding protein